MAKKKRRVRETPAAAPKSRPTKRETELRTSTGVAISTPAKSRRRRGKQRQITQEEMQEEYSYVIKDLRRIFILAAVMFVVLIGANLYLQTF